MGLPRSVSFQLIPVSEPASFKVGGFAFWLEHVRGGCSCFPFVCKTIKLLMEIFMCFPERQTPTLLHLLCAVVQGRLGE